MHSTRSSWLAGVAVEAGGLSSTIISVDAQPDNMPSSTSRSRSSTVRSYCWRTPTTRLAKPTAIQVGEPFGRILATLLRAIDRRTGQGEIQKVRSKLSLRCSVNFTEAAVVSFGARDDVLDVCIRCATEPPTRVRAVDDVAHAGDDTLLNGLRVRVIVRVVWRTAILWGDHEPPPEIRAGCGLLGSSGFKCPHGR